MRCHFNKLIKLAKKIKYDVKGINSLSQRTLVEVYIGSISGGYVGNIDQNSKCTYTLTNSLYPHEKFD